MPSPSLPVPILVAALLAFAGSAEAAIAPHPVQSIAIPSADAPPPLPGRESDARVAGIAFRLAAAGVARCPVRPFATGILFQHLLQFRSADRPGMIAALALDRGPAVIAVVPSSPAATAGIRDRDVLLQIDGVPLSREAGLDAPFDPARAHARIDAIDALLARPGPLRLTLLRDGMPVALPLRPVPACPQHVDLARSAQRNAYADGRHVFLTTGLVALTQSDDELAFVIAHEMAHNILGHAAMMRSGAAHHGVRDLERQADALAGDLMIDAGYDPVAGIAILQRLGGADLGIEIFATHDPAARRIAAMRAVAAARAAR